MRGRLGPVATLSLLVWTGAGWAADPVAVLTEIRQSSGTVRVKLAGETEWKIPQPLLSLHPGDQVRVLGDGQAVLVLTGGQGAQIVSQANSPFTIQASSQQALAGASRSAGAAFITIPSMSPRTAISAGKRSSVSVPA